MTIDEKFMHRCLQLAKKGGGFTQSNPIVGAVIVHNGKIIGEGYHRKYGEAHAEVNAIESVRQPELLPSASMYVSLEPCSHYGKTPPCAKFIIDKKIKRVVIATLDPNPKVSGRGVYMLQQAGIEVIVGVLKRQAKELNRMFFVNQIYNRPYIILKWAQSADGFIDASRQMDNANQRPTILSNSITATFVHKLRTQVQGIMVGTNTAVLDNPKLTSRKWFGNNPTRIVIDKRGVIPQTVELFNGEAKTIVFTQNGYHTNREKVKPIAIDFSCETNKQIMNKLVKEKIYSLMIEGGEKTINSFIEQNLWDEAFIEVAPICLYSGVCAPVVELRNAKYHKYLTSVQYHLKNKISQNFL